MKTFDEFCKEGLELSINISDLQSYYLFDVPGEFDNGNNDISEELIEKKTKFITDNIEFLSATIDEGDFTKTVAVKILDAYYTFNIYYNSYESVYELDGEYNDILELSELKPVTPVERTVIFYE